MGCELLVMRHAKSRWDTGEFDFDRPLAPRGHRAAKQMAEWLMLHELRPDYVISSAANRAATTAQYVIDEFGIERRCWEFRQDMYSAGALGWIAELRTHDPETAPRILICGHNPTMDELVIGLADGPVEPRPDHKLMTTAAIAHFELAHGWESLGPGAARLVTIERPR